MNNIKDKYYENFTKPITRLGSATNLLAAALSFLPAIFIWIFYKELPSLKEILRGWFLIASIYGVYYVVEPSSYFPVVGLPGIYMVSLAGNIANMRIPSAAVAQEAVGVEFGSRKAELVSTIGIAGSIITNLIIVSLAALTGAKIMGLVPPVVKEALGYVSAAIYGSMFAMFIVKDFFIGSYALGITMFMLFFLSFIPTYFMIPIAVFSSIALSIRKSKQKNKEVESF